MGSYTTRSVLVSFVFPTRLEDCSHIYLPSVTCQGSEQSVFIKNNEVHAVLLSGDNLLFRVAEVCIFTDDYIRTT